MNLKIPEERKPEDGCFVRVIPFPAEHQQVKENGPNQHPLSGSMLEGRRVFGNGSSGFNFWVKNRWDFSYWTHKKGFTVCRGSNQEGGPWFSATLRLAGGGGGGGGQNFLAGAMAST